MNLPNKKTMKAMGESARKFITEQLAENPDSMRINISDELLVIYISNSLWPAEQRLNRRIEDVFTFNEFKLRQFEEVKDHFKKELETLTERKVYKIESLLSKDNSRIIIVTFLNGKQINI